MKPFKPLFYLLLYIFVLVFFSQIKAQVPYTEKSYISIGSLQNFYLAGGAEHAWNNLYYEGLQWPANYQKQDNAVIKRMWVGANDFTDSGGQSWQHYSIYFHRNYENITLFPIQLKQISKFEAPVVTLNGQPAGNLSLAEYDSISPSQIADRLVINTVNTSLGLTMQRRILAFSQQYHDNYFITEYTFTNTGNTDYDDEIELNAPLDSVYISWGIRYSVCREGALHFSGHQTWGRHSWITKRGEDYYQHQNEIITSQNPIVQWLRCGFSWAGQADNIAYDNIGAPDIQNHGRFTAPQHAGVVVLHVDSSATIMNDDPYQPFILGWHAGDTYPSLGSMIPPNQNAMNQVYTMIQGNPHQGLGGNERFYEQNVNSITDPVSPSTIHNDIGGTNLWICYGPFYLNHGESIRIVEAEGVNGLSRKMCEMLGAQWKIGFDDPSYNGTYLLPDNSLTTDKDLFKNSWVYTGWDSILLTFSRAKRNFDSGYTIPQPPPPPQQFSIATDSTVIHLSWSDNAVSEPGFAGYRLFRAVNKTDTSYSLIFECGPGTNNPAIVHEFHDSNVKFGFYYYYYIVSINDGSNNTDGITNPAGPLYSGRFYTASDLPAYITSASGITRLNYSPAQFELKQNYPNPFNPTTNIEFSIPKPGVVKLQIFNALGEETATLVSKKLSAGQYNYVWNASEFPSGVYFYKIQTSSFIKTRKLILLR